MGKLKLPSLNPVLIVKSKSTFERSAGRRLEGARVHLELLEDLVRFQPVQACGKQDEVEGVPDSMP